MYRPIDGLRVVEEKKGEESEQKRSLTGEKWRSPKHPQGTLGSQTVRQVEKIGLRSGMGGFKT
jgi:hypothetical protein